jgi:hypothetical protein
MKKLTKQEFSERVVFFSLLAMIGMTLVLWWMQFIKYYPQIIF